MTTSPIEPLRIGILGAARIADEAVARPARDGVARLVAIAARDRGRAEAFAAAHGVATVHDSYESLLTDPEVEVVYNPLPNSLHAPWNLEALAAGKHVLTEKPYASNADEGQEVTEAAERAGLVIANGFHYRYHPMMDRLLTVITSGELGPLERLVITMRMPAPDDDDLRWSLPLAGGAMMDLGCYGLHVISSVAAALDGQAGLVSAAARERAGRPGVDEFFEIEMSLPGGVPARLYCDMKDPEGEFSITAVGSAASVRVANFIKINTDDRLIWRRPRPGGVIESVEHLGVRSTYHYQLDALTAAVRTGASLLTDGRDAVANMRLVDACYRAAGFEPRPAQTRRPSKDPA